MSIQKKEKPQFPKNVFPLFKSFNAFEPVTKKPKSKERFVRQGLQILSFLMTLFLIKETASFFDSGHTLKTEAYLKAFFVEAIVVAFTILKARSLMLSVTYKLMVAVTYTFVVCTFAGPTAQSYLNQRKEFGLNQKMETELQLEVSKLQQRSEKFYKDGWVTVARKYDLELRTAQEKLNEVRKSSLQSSDLFSIWSSKGYDMLFRLILMFSNVLLIGYIYRTKT